MLQGASETAIHQERQRPLTDSRRRRSLSWSATASGGPRCASPRTEERWPPHRGTSGRAGRRSRRPPRRAGREWYASATVRTAPRLASFLRIGCRAGATPPARTRRAPASWRAAVVPSRFSIARSAAIARLGAASSRPVAGGREPRNSDEVERLVIIRPEGASLATIGAPIVARTPGVSAPAHRRFTRQISAVLHRR